MSEFFCILAENYINMPCQPTVQSTPDAIRACLENLGFQLISYTTAPPLVQVYRYQQFTLKYDTTTQKVECYYGASSNFEYYFVSIILNCSELEMFLRRNRVIN